MTEINDIALKNLIRYHVQSRIFCPSTNHVLDERTCIVLYNSLSKNIISVFAPEVLDRVSDDVVQTLHDHNMRLIAPSERHEIAL